MIKEIWTSEVSPSVDFIILDNNQIWFFESADTNTYKINGDTIFVYEKDYLITFYKILKLTNDSLILKTEEGNISTEYKIKKATVYKSFKRHFIISFVAIPTNNVFYHYGTTGNQTGRITRQTEGSSIQYFEYGNMGEVTKNMRIFAIPNDEKTYIFRMNFEYDSWNRVKKIVYPDGEAVSYSYDRGGQMYSMSGVKGSELFSYIKSTDYDKFGNKIAVQYGNSTATEYTYDVLQRLSSLKTTCPEGYFQNISYNYDNANNITSINNAAPPLVDIGGQYSYQYEYDDMYRLIQSNGNFMNQDNYSLNMSYSPSGRINNKNQYRQKQDMFYAYCPEYQPHAPRRVYNQVKDGRITDILWDENGNMTQINDYSTRGQLLKSRYHVWDEENRLAAVLDNKYASYYTYDAAGERTLKLTGYANNTNINAQKMVSTLYFDDVTLYPSAYLVATQKGYTKHYYVGNQRILAKIGGGKLKVRRDDKTELALQARKNLYITMKEKNFINQTNSPYCLESANPVPNEPLPPAPSIYLKYDVKKNILEPVVKYADYVQPEIYNAYYHHTDHLGSGSWVTGWNGKPMQHIQYTPFGEEFVNQKRTSFAERYTFSGKEKDPETGYSYFGARYYDPNYSIWTSVDPLSDERSWVSPYSYCQNNPVVLVDPNGALDLDTKYVNQKGQLLYETQDKLTNVIIVRDADVPKLEQKLNEANTNGTLNDPETNKKELHPIGQTPEQYREEATKGMSDYWISGYKETYTKSYKEGKGQIKDNFSLSQIIAGIISALATSNNDNTGKERHSGRVFGIQDGNDDRRAGRINRMDPLSNLKNNPPLIQLNTYNKGSYPGVGLSPK